MQRVDCSAKSLFLIVCFFSVTLLVLPRHVVLADWHQKVSVQWQKRELRPALEQLAQAGHFNFYLDRRIDPGLLLEMQFQNRSVREILGHIAANLDLGYAEVGNIAYLGPKETAAVLPLLLALRQDELAKLPQTVVKNYNTPCDFRSNFLDTPALVLQMIASQAKCAPKVFDTLPHDLWPELNFAKVSPIELFTVLLAGFDMTFEISRNGKNVVPVPIDYEKVVSRNYPLSEQEMKKWREICPDASIRFFHGAIRVEGSLRTVAECENLYRAQVSETEQSSDVQPPKTESPVPLSLRRFTATITEKPVRLILASFAKTMETEIVIDEDSFKKKKVSLDQRVSVELKNATIEEALKKCLEPVGGTFRISDSKIDIYAK